MNHTRSKIPSSCAEAAANGDAALLMKSSKSPMRPRRFLSPPSSSSSGMALLMVLASIVVVSGLVLAFLATAKSEHRAASGFSDIVEANTLAELPVNLAIGQIRKATEQNGMSKTWASQPGMIRVFGTEPDPMTGNVRAKTTALYKLYSDEKMVVTRAGATPTEKGMNLNEVTSALKGDKTDLTNWQSAPGMYVDINEPAASIDGVNQQVRTVFPIVDPRATFARDGGLPVDGFQYDDKMVPGTSMPSKVDDVTARLPMPVKWLYVLADGQLAVPSSGTEAGLLFEQPEGAEKIAVPTAENPIVGRVAFWTDDESTKVNVNTAAEGTPWETPRSFNAEGVRMARRQPAQNEFSRYPGHPAQTSLSPIFQVFGADFVVNDALSENKRAEVIKRYHRLSPRTPWGGSMAGSKAPTEVVVANKDERLYSTLDELLYDRNRKLQEPELTERDIATGRFFLTTHSRAPELNLFNQPRMLLWPISANTSHRNAKDKLLAFVGSGGGKEWFFSRTQNFTNVASPGSSQSSTADLNFGGTTGGSAALKRNRELYEDYLIPLTGGTGVESQSTEGPALEKLSRDIPGFAGNFEKKYTAPRRNQILTEMFDFMRWSVNSYSVGLKPEYTYMPARADKRNGESTAAPLIPGNDTKGFGRWPTITEATMVFFVSQKHPATGKDWRMQAFIVLEPFAPSPGQPSWSADLRYRISNLNSFTVDGGSMGFPNTATMRCNVANGWLDGGGGTGFAGIGAQFKKAFAEKGKLETAPSEIARDASRDTTKEETAYPFYSNQITLNGATFEFSGGDIEIEVLEGFGTQADAKVLQKINLHLPKATLKAPRFRNGYNTFVSRFGLGGGQLVESLIGDGDITRSVELDVNGPSKGDLRLLAAMRDVPSSWFTTHADYANTNVERLHFLRQGNQTVRGQYGPNDGGLNLVGKAPSSDRTSTRNTAGTLVQGITYARDSTPAVARGQNGAFNAYGRQGDFDNGMGRVEDGPYINKGDESNIASNSQAVDGSLDYFSRGGYGVETSGVSYSPNRQIASAVAFGSLPSGIYSSSGGTNNTPPPHKPWQTLLFSPNPASRTTAADQEPNEQDHEGFKGPRDHLWLDLFWMPIVEPYAISESFATAGKINMNHQLQPFTHIERSTGLHAVLKPTLLTAITPRSVGGVGEAGYNNIGGENYKEGTLHKYDLQYQVNRRETLKGLQRRFDQGDVYRSASEICEIFLVPQRLSGASYNSDAPAPPSSYDKMLTWWNGSGSGTPDAFQPTGDNSREAPYNQLYPRLTTKSNTFTVHYRVQTLKRSRSGSPSVWVESTDRISAEHRGSVTLERYVDPNDPKLAALPSPATKTEESWDAHYRFRIIERKTFSP